MPRPTAEMATEAERGLKWRDEYNRGGTAVGVARARDIANRRNLSDDTVRRMVSYFARHEVDKQGEGFSPGEPGYPSAGRIAWALWGGDPGRTWAEAEVKRMGADNNQRRIREELSCSFKLTECHMTPEGEEPEDGVVARFQGIASVFGQQFDAYVPSLGAIVPTIVHPGSFAKTIQERRPEQTKILWQHRTDLPPIGAAVQLAESRDGLLIAGKIIDTTLGEDVAKLMRGGVLGELSIGATPIKTDYSNPDAPEVRNVREYMLHEVSVVDEGANPGSRVTELMQRAEDEFWSGLAARCARASDEELLNIALSPFGGAEGHAGRVLSERNTTLVKQAIEALSALLAAAEPQSKTALTVPRSEVMGALLRLTELEQRINFQGVR